MKVRYPLLSVLIMGSMSVLGLSEHPPNELAREAVCMVRCKNIQAREECRRLCHLDAREIPVLDVVSKVGVCRYHYGLRVSSDHGDFITEVRNETSDWVHVKTTLMERGSSDLPYKILPSGSHQLRFTRVFSDGISRSEIKDFTMPRPDYNPAIDLDLWVQCLTLETVMRYSSNTTLTADIGFRSTVEIPRCAYLLICGQDRGGFCGTSLILFPGPSQNKATFKNLPLGQNFTLYEESDTPNIVIKFSTPSPWRSYYGRTEICVPDHTEDLDAVVIRNRKKNTIDVRVSWRQPHYIPDSFIVNITSNGEELNGSTATGDQVPGTLTEIIFWGVNISTQFNVSIRGWSTLLGGGPLTSKSFKVPDQTVGLAVSDQPSSSIQIIIITAVLVSAALLVIIGVRIYLMSGRRRGGKSSKRDKDEIDPDRLTITRILGSGAFGVVKFGRLRDDNGWVIDVAVKMLRDDTNDRELRNFRLEIEMMKSLGKHPNIVSFVGYRTTGLYPFLVVEYCPRGDLLSFLRAASLETKPTAVAEPKDERYVSAPRLCAQDTTPEEHSEASEDEETYIDTVDANRDTNTVTVLDMLNFGRQIATGMEFLSSKRIVHRDLAARNILVCDKGVVKISDFGMSRDIYQENMYRKTGNGRMPFKWMAIESLIHQVYTTESDVWAFGILLWEIFTLGSTPYPEIPTLGILKLLQSGYRMERPENCTEALYNVMLSCWKMKPKDRPTFSLLRKQLDQLIGMTSEREYLDADYIFAGMPLEGDSRTPSPSNDTSIPLQESNNLEDNLEPKIIRKDLDPPRIEAEVCVEV